MTTIITRAGKGSSITNTEFDTNLTNLNSGKVENDGTRSPIRPTLLLDFANTEKLDPRITFTRASTGTYYDGMTTALAEQNLLPYSQTFVWGYINTTTSLNANTDPIGTSTATKLIPSATTDRHGIYSNIAPIQGQPYTFSVYIKAAELNYAMIAYGVNSGSNTGYFFVDLINGTISNTVNNATYFTTITPTIVSVGNGWYRCSITASSIGAGITALGCGIFPTDQISNITYAAGAPISTGDASKGIFIWGAQAEQRSTATAYFPTGATANTNYIPVIQTAANNIARFDNDPVTGESKGLLVEESRTNLLGYSSDISNSAYRKFSLTVLGAANIAPDGTQTASLATGGGATSVYFDVYPADYGSNGGIVQTFSIYAKAPVTNAAATVQLFITGYSATFNLTTGAITGQTATNATATSVGNGWWRFSCTGTKANQYYSWGASLPNNSTASVYFWGAQIENGSFATSYIPTTLTYSGRASTATYTGFNGLIQTAQQNVPRYQLNNIGTPQILLESAATNLLSPTQRMNSIASQKNNCSIIENIPNIIAPDGTLTVSKLVEDVGANNHILQITKSVSAGAYTFSIFVAAAERTWVRVGIFDTSTSSYVFVNLATGALGTQGGVAPNPTVTKYANGWWRISVTQTVVSATTYLQIFTATSGSQDYVTGTGSSGLYIWGAQFESGSTVSSYIPSIETFTSRANTATYYDSGTTALAEQNLFTYSQNFVTNWTNNATVTPTINSNTAPDGTSTATLIVESTNNGVHSAYQTFTKSSTVYTVSVYAKAKERSKFAFSYSSNFMAANYDLVAVTATPTGTTTATITDVGNGWYRCTATRTDITASGSDSVYIVLLDNSGSQTYLGDGTSGMYFWGAQLETRSSPTAYTPTTTTAITNYIPRLLTAPVNAARYDFDPVTRLYKGITLEPASTNIVLNSQTFSGYSLTNMTILNNFTIAPDGSNTASRVSATTTDACKMYNQYPSSPLQNPSTFTQSVYAKAGTYGYINLMPFAQAGTGYSATFNLNNGTYQISGNGGVSATMTPVGNGWYRCVIICSYIYYWTPFGLSLTSYSGNSDAGWTTLYPTAGQYVLLWGAQCEVLPIATSYIPTTTVAVTRAADIYTSTAQTRTADIYSSSQVTRASDLAVITGTNFSSWYRNDSHTTYVEFSFLGSSNTHGSVILNLAGSSSSNGLQLYRGTGSGTVWQYVDNTLTLITNSMVDNTVYKVTFGYNLGINSGSLNGASVFTNTGLLGTVPTYMNIGSDNASGSRMSGYIKRIAFYPTKLTDTQITQLSSQ